MWRNDRFPGDGRGMFPKAMAAASWETHLTVVFVGTVIAIAYGILFVGDGKPTLHDRLYGTTTVWAAPRGLTNETSLVIGVAPVQALIDGGLEQSVDDWTSSSADMCTGGLSILVGRNEEQVAEVELVNRSGYPFAFWFDDNEKLQVEPGMRLLSNVPSGWVGRFSFLGANVATTYRSSSALAAGERYVDMFCSDGNVAPVKGFQRS